MGNASELRNQMNGSEIVAQRWKRVLPHIGALAPRTLDRCSPVTAMLQRGADASVLMPALAEPDALRVDGNGASPLCVALLHGAAPDMIKLLVERGADVNERDDNGVSPLEVWLAAGADPDSFEVLRMAGVDGTPRSSRDETFAHLAAQRELAEGFEQLRSVGTDLDARDDRGWTALHYAAFSSRQVARGLLSAGANPDIRTPSGDTPLSLSATMALAAKTDCRLARTVTERPGEHLRFLRALVSVVALCRRANLRAPTPDGTSIAQLLADIGHPLVTKAAKRRRVRLPAPRLRPRVEVPTVPRTMRRL